MTAFNADDVQRGKVAYRMGEFHRDDDVVRVILSATASEIAARALREHTQWALTQGLIVGILLILAGCSSNAGGDAYNDCFDAAKDEAKAIMQENVDNGGSNGSVMDIIEDSDAYAANKCQSLYEE